MTSRSISNQWQGEEEKTEYECGIETQNINNYYGGRNKKILYYRSSILVIWYRIDIYVPLYGNTL